MNRISPTETQLLTHTLCLKKRPNFETVWLEILRTDFDNIWQKCFSFQCRSVFFLNFSSFKSDIENNPNFDAVSSKCANFDAVQ